MQHLLLLYSSLSVWIMEAHLENSSFFSPERYSTLITDYLNTLPVTPIQCRSTQHLLSFKIIWIGSVLVVESLD